MGTEAKRKFPRRKMGASRCEGAKRTSRIMRGGRRAAPFPEVRVGGDADAAGSRGKAEHGMEQAKGEHPTKQPKSE